MEKVVEELQVDALPNQFWGAIKIFTEKPHVINRRICGTVNLWVGLCDEEFCRRDLLNSVFAIISQPDKNKKCKMFSNSVQTKFTGEVNETASEEILADPIDMNLGEELKDENGVVNAVQKKICSHGFETWKSCGGGAASDSQDGEREGKTEPKPENSTPGDKKWTIPWERVMTADSSVVAVVRKILPKQVDKFAPVTEVVLLDGKRQQATYMTSKTKSEPAAPSITPQANYSLSFTITGISLSCSQENSEVEEQSVVWLKEKLLPKVCKWTSEVSIDGNVGNTGSLQLIDVEEYNQLYQKLKLKYGKPLVKMWPEVTDPLKFVYEDISIATYLILLWQQERQQKGLTSHQTFVDLGCGNGLLVYILSSEGHHGLGIDVKKRKIWDSFPVHVKLKEGTIEPSDKNLFPEHDWLIGNHSDELTPWIPVMAAKSSSASRFFVIPCCPHDFSHKYRRRHAGRSQYADYLEYIKEVGEVCGFKVWQDKLRIPSTKRICLVGSEKLSIDLESGSVIENIDKFIKARTSVSKEVPDAEEDSPSFDRHKSENTEVSLSNNNMWTKNFKAREHVQPVRNCTQLKSSVREDLTSTVATILLEKKHMVEVDIGGNTCVKWDRGGSMTLGDLAKRLEPRLLAALKKECGGLQTLLKNHRYIFSIANGEVSLQVPQSVWKGKVSSSLVKTKLCWFHANHNSGCPLPSEICMYAHGEEDVRKNVLKSPSTSSF